MSESIQQYIQPVSLDVPWTSRTARVCAYTVTLTPTQRIPSRALCEKTSVRVVVVLARGRTDARARAAAAMLMMMTAAATTTTTVGGTDGGGPASSASVSRASPVLHALAGWTTMMMDRDGGATRRMMAGVVDACETPPRGQQLSGRSLLKTLLPNLKPSSTTPLGGGGGDGTRGGGGVEDVDRRVVNGGNEGVIEKEEEEEEVNIEDASPSSLEESSAEQQLLTALSNRIFECMATTTKRIEESVARVALQVAALEKKLDDALALEGDRRTPACTSPGPCTPPPITHTFPQQSRLVRASPSPKLFKAFAELYLDDDDDEGD